MSGDFRIRLRSAQYAYSALLVLVEKRMPQMTPIRPESPEQQNDNETEPSTLSGVDNLIQLSIRLLLISPLALGLGLSIVWLRVRLGRHI